MPLSPYDPAYGAIPVPEAGIFEEPTILVCFNPEWAGYIDGAVSRLLRDTVWLGDESEQAAAVDEVRKFLAALQERNPCEATMDRAANTFYAGPGSGADAPATWRTIVPADIVTALTTPPPIGSTTPNTGKFTTLSGKVSDAGTNTVVDALTISHLSSATPLGGFGVAAQFNGKSNGNTERPMARLRAVWLNENDAVRVSQAIISTWNVGTETDVALFHPNRVVLDSAIPIQMQWRSGATQNMAFYHDASNFLMLNSVGSMSFRNLASGGTIIWYTNNIARLKILADGKISATNVAFDAQTQFHVHLEDNATNAATETVTVSHNSTGTPAAGFGAAVLTTLESSTTANRKASVIKTLWNVATDSGAIADLVLSAYYNAAGTVTEREGFRVRGGASAVQWAIAGGTVGATETVTGSRGGNAALADLLTKLANKGIIVDGSS